MWRQQNLSLVPLTPKNMPFKYSRLETGPRKLCLEIEKQPSHSQNILADVSENQLRQWKNRTVQAFGGEGVNLASGKAGSRGCYGLVKHFLCVPFTKSVCDCAVILDGRLTIASKMVFNSSRFIYTLVLAPQRERKKLPFPLVCASRHSMLLQIPSVLSCGSGGRTKNMIDNCASQQVIQIHYIPSLTLGKQIWAL